MQSSAVSAVSRTLSLGRLVGLQWRVGVGVSSSLCSALAAPFVTLAFDVAVAGGGGGDGAHQQPPKSFVVECNHHEFQEVRAAFQDVFARLDTA